MQKANLYSDFLDLRGIRIDGDSSHANIFIPIVTGEEDYPLKNDKRILLLHRTDAIESAIEIAENLSLPDKQMWGARAERVSIVYDLPMALYLIAAADRDEGTTIVKCLNFLLILMDSSVVKMPAVYKDGLHRFANHLTFSKDIRAFFEGNHINRQDILNAIIWSIGAVMVQSKWL